MRNEMKAKGGRRYPSNAECGVANAEGGGKKIEIREQRTETKAGADRLGEGVEGVPSGRRGAAMLTCDRWPPIAILTGFLS
jgi:hypothetical protein